jgi:catechol 2,3-dioxygenase-like lactoylglutathione lyase family enzyme
MTAAMKPHFIVYVADQEASARFYARVLDRRPVLDVPGMTEFALDAGAVLGLMPATGISRLLGDRLPPVAGAGTAKAEIYLRVEDAAACHARAIASGARELSGLEPRDWGDDVAYSLDPDGYVLAFAQASHREETDRARS